MGFLSCFMINLFLLLQVHTLFVLSQNIKNGSVPVGESLTASVSQQFSSSWRSPSGDFAFGFRKIQPNDGFTLSIWFDKIPDRTIVWHAQVNTTGLVPDGSKVRLVADRGLVLTDPQDKELWSSSLNRNGRVSRGNITDAGDFGLFNEDSDTALWSSFDNPTDTLLPTQMIERGGNLSSRRTETSFEKGRFRLQLGDDGDLRLLLLNAKTLDTDVYLSYYQSKTTEPNPGIELVFNKSGYMYVLQENNSTVYVNEDVHAALRPSTEYYHRAVLHFDGVFAVYDHPKDGSGGWRMAWSEPENICSLTGESGNLACGFNSICSLGDNKRPKCQCPERYSLLDPSDKYGDCKPDFPMQSCERKNNQTENENVDVNHYELIRVDHADWPAGGNYEIYAQYDEERCKKACLDDCFCAAVVVRRDELIKCWKKKFPLSYGRQDDQTDTFLKVLKHAGEVPIPITRKKEKNLKWLIIVGSVLLGTLAFVNFILLALNRKIKKNMKNPSQVRDIGAARFELNLRVFTYKELAEATGDFMEELGRGAFGIVYKGVLKVAGNSEVTVAVKKLDRVVQEGEKEFKNEVNAIGQTHHKNLVRLIGFCNDGQSRLIVYEFLAKGTLAGFLFRRPRPSWEDRRRIAVEIARGILYLHEECSEQIIHCDIKPQNILLDECYTPKISDFGLAKLLMMNQTHTLTNIRGTKGYVAPEWFRNSRITTKVDVYSFGVMLLEIVCCKKAVDLEDNVILVDWAYDCFQQGRLGDLIKGDLEVIDDLETVLRYVKIGIWCIQEEPGMRPNMRNVTQMLESVAQVHDPPNPSPYSVSVSVLA